MNAHADVNGATRVRRARFPMPAPPDMSGAPPGPRVQRHILGVRWLLTEHALLERCRERYGDVFSLKAWPLGLLVIVCDPDEIKRIFTGDPNTLQAGEGNSVLEPITGPQSVLLLDGEEHLHRRKLMLPSFHGERMSAYGGLIEDIANNEIDAWPLRTVFPVHPSMQRITLRVILRAVFGIENAVRMGELERLIPGLLGSPALVWPILQHDLGPGSPWRRFRVTRGAVDAILLAQIARTREDPDLAQRSDVLSLLLQARDEDGQQMSDPELRDQLMTLLLAGHETTATALAWTFERVLRTPQVLERLRATLAEGEDDYLECTIKESLRSRPVVNYAMRRLTAPMMVSGYTVPAGSFLGTSIILTHNHPGLYPNPQRFDPDRFADKRIDTYTWVPFGGGIRRCLGAAFATYEMKTILKAILDRCELTAPEQKPERSRRRLVTYVPNRGARVVLQRRVPTRRRGRALDRSSSR